MGSWLIRGGRVIDPAQGIDEIVDVSLADGRISGIGRSAVRGAEQTLDAAGLIVAPGLIDMHVHLREPGQEERETIATGTAAAVAGGFTGVACMPNTEPALDDDTQIEFVLRRAAQTGLARVYPIGALTKRREGRELAEIGLMVRAGAVGFSDDGTGIESAAVCLQAMRYVAMFDKLFIQHCEDRSLAGRGCMNAGVTATRLGLPGIPAMAEELMLQRDVTLARGAGVRYHACHVSAAESVAVVRRARASGQRVSTEVCPHHLLLTEDACSSYDPNCKVNPPLRTQADVDACLRGVQDGTIECLITDHAPHSAQFKEQGFQDAPFGMIGLETALPLLVRALIEPKRIDWPRMIALLSTNPARLLGIPGGSLAVGGVADVTLIDPACEWTIDAARMRSKSRNTPFDGWRVRGKARATIVGGELRHRDE